MPAMHRPAGYSAKIPPASPTSGLIASTVPGRTDRHAMRVRPGSFIVPADIVSGVGQGNTLAGAKLLGEALKTGPYGSKLPKPVRGGIGLPRPPRLARFDAGGTVPETDILTAGGEMVIDPEQVAALGEGDIKLGTKHLHNMVASLRKQIIAEMQKLPGTKR